MKQQLHDLQSMPKATKINLRLISKLLTIVFVLSTNFAQSQFLSSAPSLTATPTNGIYGSYGNATLFIYLDIDPNAPASGGVSGGSNNNGSLTTTTDYGVTATLPFRADIRLVITPSYLGYSIRDSSGGWKTEVNISSGNVGTSGGSVRSAKIPWTTGGLLGSRPAAFNWLGYAGYSTGVYDQFPTINTTGAGASPRFYYYQTVTNTSNTSTTNPFSTSQRSFETRNNFGYNNTQPSTIFDFTVNGNTTTFTNTLTVINNFHIASGTFTNLSSGGASTLTMGSGSTNTPSIRCDGTLTPNNGTGNDLSVVAAFGTTTIAGSASNTAFRLFNLTVNNGATVQAPSSGTVDLGWQFGTITVNSGGTLNFVNGSGVVNSTVIDVASNTVSISNSAGGSLTFNNLTVVGTTNTTILQSANSGTNLINIKGNLVRTGGNTSFSTSNSSGTLDVTMNGTTTQNLPTGTFRNLTIANTADSVITAGNLTITTAGNKKLIINSGARLVLKNNLTFTSNTSNAPDSVIVNGFLRQSSSVTITGGGTGNSVLFVSGTGTYEHSINSGTIPTATWATNSTCLVTGTAGTMATGFGQSFFNVTFNCPNITGGRNLAGALISVAGTLSVISTGSGSIRLNNSLDVSQVDYVGNIANISVSGGTLGLIGGNNGTFNCSSTVNVSGNVTLSNSGILDMNVTSNTTLASTLNIQGNLTMSSTSTIQRSANAIASINFNKSSGTQNFTQNGGAISTDNNPINWNFGTVSPATSPTVLFGSNISIGGSGVITNNSSVDCQTYSLAFGGSPTLANNGTIRTANLSSTSLPTGRTWGGTVEFYGASTSQVIPTATSYNNLLITGSPLTSTQTINGNLTISGAGLLTFDNAASSRSLTIGGNINFSGSGGLTYLGTGSNSSFLLTLTGTSNTITCTSSANDFTKTSILINTPASYTLSTDFDMSSAVSSRTISGTGTITLNGKTFNIGRATFTVSNIVTDASSTIISSFLGTPFT
ncbi:MAG: hypothetical protein NTZ59_15525, partial [Bacteroidetes bacterium]|nr:hypothetical protein [Bacteroidota bacterium]